MITIIQCKLHQKKMTSNNFLKAYSLYISNDYTIINGNNLASGKKINAQNIKQVLIMEVGIVLNL